MSTYGRHPAPAPSAFAHPHPSIGSTFPATTPASTTLFRRLTWEGTVPLEIRVDSHELPAGADRGLDCYYVQAPRVWYLPLVMGEVRKFLMEIVFDESNKGALGDGEEWWFEGEEGGPMKW
jgi:autophagy-related protein 5